MIIARNTLYPDTKTKGNGSHRFVVFTSVHGMSIPTHELFLCDIDDRPGHYSVEKAAIMCGLGSDAVWKIPVDREGRMVIAGKS